MPDVYELPIRVSITKAGVRQPAAEAAARDALVRWAAERRLEAQIREEDVGLTVVIAGTRAELQSFATDVFLSLRKVEPVGDA